MKPHTPWDQGSTPRIQLPLALALAALLLGGCKQEAEKEQLIDPPKDSGPVVPAQPGPDEMPALDSPDSPDSPDSYDAQGSEDSEPRTGILGTGDQAKIQAVGKALKSRDISLARQAASSRARHQIANILKEKGYTDSPPGTLRGVTIEKVWTKGKFVYALAVLSLADRQAAVNDPAQAASNPTEDEPLNKTPSFPNRGDEP